MGPEGFDAKDREEYGALKSTVAGHEKWIPKLDGKLDAVVEKVGHLASKAEITDVKLDAITDKLDKALERRSPRRGVKTVGALGATAGGGGLIGLLLYEWGASVVKAILAKFGG